jgi:hypothetical protein
VSRITSGGYTLNVTSTTPDSDVKTFATNLGFSGQVELSDLTGTITLNVVTTEGQTFTYTVTFINQSNAQVTA